MENCSWMAHISPTERGFQAVTRPAEAPTASRTSYAVSRGEEGGDFEH